MAEKVKVSHKVAEAYQELLDKHEGNSLAVVYEWSEKILAHKTNCVLKDIDWFTLLALITGGYEVFDVTPEEDIAEIYLNSKQNIKTQKSVSNKAFNEGVCDGIITTLNLLNLKIEGVNE
ncbi:hypothetical protein FH508_0003980 [Lysinibacillus sp. CD3-6]|uniref:hypothetical protein n=1 Tax=Lysinibacillus sp. CD3-6 TaxID=2892541 RepID=UPI001172D25D|nr:hypothetical protein [Lysinibacillus sp. CD3-6]UED81058.1 hypothetical protein FH508_0003980 [Lysinibacillus sp. CD3-6]